MARAMKETKRIMSAMTEGIEWKKMNTRQKLITVWFGVSFLLLVLLAESIPLMVLVLINFGLASHYVVKNVPTKEE